MNLFFVLKLILLFLIWFILISAMTVKISNKKARDVVKIMDENNRINYKEEYESMRDKGLLPHPLVDDKDNLIKESNTEDDAIYRSLIQDYVHLRYEFAIARELRGESRPMGILASTIICSVIGYFII